MKTKWTKTNWTYWEMSGDESLPQLCRYLDYPGPVAKDSAHDKLYIQKVGRKFALKVLCGDEGFARANEVLAVLPTLKAAKVVYLLMKDAYVY
jgi:hypothetical protein